MAHAKAELNLTFYLAIIRLYLNSHLWLVAVLLSSEVPLHQLRAQDRWHRVCTILEFLLESVGWELLAVTEMREEGCLLAFCDIILLKTSLHIKFNLCFCV
jgi:hypothetical protein